MRASDLQPSSLQYSSFLKEGGSKAGSSHFKEKFSFKQDTTVMLVREAGWNPKMFRPKTLHQQEPSSLVTSLSPHLIRSNLPFIRVRPKREGPRLTRYTHNISYSIKILLISRELIYFQVWLGVRNIKPGRFCGQPASRYGQFFISDYNSEKNHGKNFPSPTTTHTS